MSQELQTRKFLLIDDDKGFRETICRTAEKAGIAFHAVASLSELKKLKAIETFDAVLVDYDLDDMTGFQVAEILVTLLKDKPVLLISSTNRPYQDKLIQLPNVVGFVSKWTTPDDFFVKAMETLLDRPTIAA